MTFAARILAAVACTLLVGGATEAQITPGENRAAFERDAERLVQSYTDTGNFSGNVLVAYDGKPIFRKTSGLADRGWNLPTTPDTVYRIGSTTKMFTAVAVLQLVQAGKVSLNESVRTYLPSTPESWQAVTVRMLLNQTSGIPEFLSTTNSFTGLVRVDRTPEEVLGLVRDQPLQFTPGEKFSYSNSNYVALGQIIEKVSGQTYESYLADHIFGPLKMTRTGYYDPARVTPRTASGYIAGNDGVEAMFYISPSMTYASGNLYSTADDLLIWDQALHSKDSLLLDPVLRDRMFADTGKGYGLGAFIDKVEGQTYVGHGGTLPGFNTDYQRFTGLPLTIILLSNTYPADVDKLTRDLATAFFKICGVAEAARQCGLN